jgi:hypothetical protein
MNRIHGFWGTANFPEDVRMEITPADEFKLQVRVNGDSEYRATDSVEKYLSVVQMLGNEMMSHLEVTSYTVDDNSIHTTTYILYYIPCGVSTYDQGKRSI